MTHKQFNQVRKYVTGKKVLDVGAVQHSYEKTKSEGWTHRLLQEEASELVGIDLLEDAVARLQEDGYNVVLADAQDFDIGEKFDVVFAGELIEHLSNPGAFLENALAHLHSDGLLVLTTPNAFGARYSIKNMCRRGMVPNPEHTAWFCQHTIETLLERSGFEVDEIGFYEDATNSTRADPVTRSWLFFAAFLPDRFYNQMYVVASPRE